MGVEFGGYNGPSMVWIWFDEDPMNRHFDM